MLALVPGSVPLYPRLSERLHELEREHPRLAQLAVLIAGVVLIVGLALLLLGVRAPGLALCAVAAAPALALVFMEQPVPAFLAFWVFSVVKQTLAAMAGSGGTFTSSGTSLSHLIQNLDDAIMVVFLVCVLGRYLQRRVGRLEWCLVGAATLIGVLGVLSGLVLSVGLRHLGISAWLGLKLWTWVLVAASLPWRRRDVGSIWKVTMAVGLVVLVFALIDLVLPHQLRGLLGTNQVPNTDFRQGSAVQSFFTDPASFSLMASSLFAIAYARLLLRRGRLEAVFCVLFLIAALLSERVKAVACVAAVLVLLPLLVYGVRRIPLRAAVIGAVVLLAAIAVMLPVLSHQLRVYRSFSDPRAQLYLASLRIADDHFPLGVGFGRFATSQSVTPYSSVYRQYGLSQVYGLSPQTKFYLLDTSWPGVLGETGWIGLLAYLGAFLALAIAVWQAARTDPGEHPEALIALGLIIVVLVDSVANYTLFDGMAVTTLALGCGPALALMRSRDA
jgi:hypothetical protein